MVGERIKYQGRIYFERSVFANIYLGIVSKLNQFLDYFFTYIWCRKSWLKFKSVQTKINILNSNFYKTHFGDFWANFESWYFSIIEVLDPGFSQFRGLTLYQLFLGEYLLLLQDKLNLENILESERKDLRETLELCMRCLSVELENSASGRVYIRAKGYLELLNQTK